jgi:hypothetical protein
MEDNSLHDPDSNWNEYARRADTMVAHHGVGEHTDILYHHLMVGPVYDHDTYKQSDQRATA